MTAQSPEPFERKWRVGLPTAGVPGSLYDFIRRFLVSRGGTCSRQELLDALYADPVVKSRLERSRGFAALISNMRHSGDILIVGEIITVTSRALRRLSLHGG